MLLTVLPWLAGTGAAALVLWVAFSGSFVPTAVRALLRITWGNTFPGRAVAAGMVHSATDVTPAWLTARLQRDFPGARVTSVAVRGMGSDHGNISDMQRLTVTADDGRVPTSMILKIHPQSLLSRVVGDSIGGLRVEPVFYNAVQPDAPVTSLHAYAAAYGPNATSYILMQDVMTAFPGRRVTLPSDADGLDVALTTALVAQLADFHAHFWNSPALDTEPLRSVPRQTHSTLLPSKRVLAALYKRFLAQQPTGFPPILDAIPALLDVVGVLTQMQAQPPVSLLHHDVRAGNTFVLDGSAVGLFDWQVMRVGRAAMDVAMIVSSTAVPGTDGCSEATARGLVRQWVQRLHDRGVRDYDFDTAWADFKLSCALWLLWGPGALGATSSSDARLPDLHAWLRRMFHCAHNIGALQFAVDTANGREDFTPWSALGGGAIIGGATALHLVTTGRVTGISGTVRRLVDKPNWAHGFTGGLLLSGSATAAVLPTAFGAPVTALVPVGGVVAAGLLAGAGTDLGSGCTSGHLCGMMRLSTRSFVAATCFMTTGMGTATLLAHSDTAHALLRMAPDVATALPGMPAGVAPLAGAVLVALPLVRASLGADGVTVGSVAASAASGGVFGVGLGVSGMGSPAKVLGFLDPLSVTGWDPSLACVMAGAAVTGTPVWQRMLRSHNAAPVVRGLSLDMPTRTHITPALVCGSSLFGVGWGLAGLCPGPALLGLASVGGVPLLLWVAAFMGGQRISRRLAANMTR